MFYRVQNSLVDKVLRQMLQLAWGPALRLYQYKRLLQQCTTVIDSVDV